MKPLTRREIGRATNAQLAAWLDQLAGEADESNPDYAAIMKERRLRAAQSPQSERAYEERRTATLRIIGWLAFVVLLGIAALLQFTPETK